MPDYRVAEAQAWVNKTYKTRIFDPVKFPPLIEDGITGWDTIHALTRALQWELGIPELSDNFGDATLANLWGGIGELDGGDIVQLVQCAFYCKGYSTGGMDGDWGDDTTKAATQMCFDSGVITDGREVKRLTAKMLKGLFSMDAYVVIPTGTEAIRAVQRWLNGRYVDFLNFYVIPADGIFSRNVQRALYLAIQFEMGLSPTAATGSFGPATRKYLQEHPISVGQRGFLVQIFTGAMVFQRIQVTPQGGGPQQDFTGFSESFTSYASEILRTFQRFSALPMTGVGDFSTWCQLLVSTGNPDRAVTACDTSTPLTTSTAAALRSAGYQYVGRYLANKPITRPGETVLNKMIQPGELDIIFNAGLRVFPIFQYYGGEAAVFTYELGRNHGFDAHAAAVQHRVPKSTVIYFAVDFDATQAEINSNIAPYFNGVAGALALRDKRYVLGVYGSRNVCADVTTRARARYSFVAGMSSGFSGNMGFAMPSNWSFNQIQTVKIGGIDIDRVAHREGSDIGFGSFKPVSTMDEFIAYIRKVQQLANTYRSTIGGSWMDNNQMVLNFLRHPQYTRWDWWALLGVIDGLITDQMESWITYANDRLIKIETVRDQVYGIEFHVDHFAATCISVYLKGESLSASGKPPNVSAADFGGWGGDWIQHYGDWQAAIQREPIRWFSGLDFCRARLAKTDAEIAAGGFNSSFKLRDLFEDVAGFNVGTALRTKPGASLVDEVVYSFQGPGRLRSYQDFYAKRFGNDPAALKALANNMLEGDHRYPFGPSGSVMSVGKVHLITTICKDAVMPDGLADGRLALFCEGLAELLVGKVQAEKALTP